MQVGGSRGRSARHGVAAVCDAATPPPVAGHRRAGSGWSRRDADDPDLQSEQPDRLATDAGGTGRHLRCRRPLRRWVRRTRSTVAPSWTASRPPDASGDATTARSSRAACRRLTGCPGYASAGWRRRPTLVEALWGVHDYTTIAPGPSTIGSRGSRSHRRAANGCWPARAGSSAPTTRSSRSGLPVGARHVSHVPPERRSDRVRPLQRMRSTRRG